MNKFGIISDTSHDLEAEYVTENDIRNVSFYVRLDEENYLRDEVDITRRQLYDYLKANPEVFPKTSLPSIEDYIKQMRSVLESGNDVICFTVSSTLSGSFQSANVAAELMRLEFPDREIYVIDAESASLGVGLLIKEAVELRKTGKDIVEVIKELKEKVATTEIYILLDSLSYLEKGGRISKTGAFAGNLLKIKPIASFKENKLTLEKAVRGTKKALAVTLELLDNTIGENPEDYEVFVIHGDNEKLANQAVEELEAKYNIKINEDITLVSTAVISHIGPGAIGLGCTLR